VSAATGAHDADHIRDTTPYPWPWDGTIDIARIALVIVGAGGWGRCVPDDPERRHRLGRLRSGLTAAKVTTFVVSHDACLDRHPALLVAGPADVRLAAAGIDAFFASALDVTLRRQRRTHLILAGYGAETTVHSTMRSANDRGYECLAVLDASPPHDVGLAGATRSSIEMSGGIFGCVGETDAVLERFTAVAFTADP
jgi:hypothetical protein